MASTSYIPSELFYLSSQFDINMMLGAQIRKILREQNVQVPSTAAKKELVRLFKHEVIARKDEILATVAAPAATAAAANAAPNVMTRAAAAARQKQKSADQKKKQKTKKHEARETRGKGKKVARKASPAEFSTASDSSSSDTSDTSDASSSSMQISDNPSEVGAGSKQQQVGIDGSGAAASRRPHPFSSAAAAVKSPPAGTSIELSTNAWALDDRTRSLNTWVTADLGGEMQALHESFSGLQIKVNN